VKQKEGSRLVAVELPENDRDGSSRLASGLEVVPSSGRRIEVRRDFDSETLRRVVRVLEEI
jgi:hypothetical protein